MIWARISIWISMMIFRSMHDDQKMPSKCVPLRHSIFIWYNYTLTPQLRSKCVSFYALSIITNNIINIHTSCSPYPLYTPSPYIRYFMQPIISLLKLLVPYTVYVIFVSHLSMTRPSCHRQRSPFLAVDYH